MDNGRNVTGHLWGMKSETMRAGRGRDAYGLKLGYPNDRISWSLGYSQIDKDFTAALGFVPRPGIREYFGSWRQPLAPGRATGSRTIDTSVGGGLTTDLDDNVESGNAEWELLDIETHSGDSFGLDLDRIREVLIEPFEISDGIVIPKGDYRWNRGERVCPQFERPAGGCVLPDRHGRLLHRQPNRLPGVAGVASVIPYEYGFGIRTERHRS